MAFIGNDEIRGYQLETGMYCCDCVPKEGLQDLKQGEIITSTNIETADGDYFCDSCQKEL